jgi:ribosomal protein S3AE
MAKAKKKKKFFEVEMPLIRRQTQLQAYEPKELDGRYIKYDLTRSLRGKSMLIKFKVNFKDDNLTTSPKEIKLMPYFLRRMMRKGTNYVEDSFSTQCEDAQIRIKPFLITRRKVSRAVRKALREKAREELINYVKDRPSMVLFEEILKNLLQKRLSLRLKKIYPLSLCEIRVLKVEKELEKQTKEKPKEENIKKE